MIALPGFSLSGILTAATSFGFGVLVLVKSPNRKLGATWFIFGFFVACWGLGAYFIGRTLSPQKSLTIWRITYSCGVLWIAILFFHFVKIFLNRPTGLVLKINYAIAIVFLCLIPTSLFFSKTVFVFNQFYYARGGLLYPFFFCWWICLVIWSHADLLLAFRQEQRDKKNRIKYFFIATGIGYLGGGTAFFSNFGIDLYPWGNFGIVLYPLIMSYAILRHRLMDINVIIRKTLIYSMVTIPLTGAYLGIITLCTHLFEGLTGYQTLFSSAVAACLITLAFQPLRKRVQTFVDGKFFREYVDREEKLYELSREVITHTTPEGMADALMQVLGESLHPKSAALYLRSRHGNDFVRVSSQDNERLPHHVLEDNILPGYFKDHPQPFIQDIPSGIGESQNTRKPERKEDVA